MNPGLSGLALLSNAETRSISAENPTGARGGGARAEVPDEKMIAAMMNEMGIDAAHGFATHPSSMLGKGWKVRPCMTVLPPGTTTLADVDGPGVIQHIWITVSEEAYRDTVLRFYWDGEVTPSIETPLGDFFCNGHGLRCNVNSLPVAVNPVGGFNCYWPMPFRQHARITIENQRPKPIFAFFYQITYALTDLPQNVAYLHAQWRRSLTRRDYPEHVILDGVQGQGQYVGTYLAWTQFSNGWWGEGEVKFYLDGDEDYPTICGTGTEDYFGGAWCFGGEPAKTETYSTPFLGYPLYRHEPGEVPRHGLYRWHVMDPVHFKQDLKVTVQALGWWPNRTFEPLTDDIASVAYWYQSEPHTPFSALPAVHERWSR
ncbi:MAG: DUF2961 domain-containing protein [Anaerolineae bacterium]|nr:DUF2961 domain-containing protein [Anaerolineae bacterium]